MCQGVGDSIQSIPGLGMIVDLKAQKYFMTPKRQIDAVVGQFMQQPGIQGLANAFRVALACEATLRWDDYEDMSLGDFIVTNRFVRVFLTDATTDSMKSGVFFCQMLAVTLLIVWTILRPDCSTSALLSNPKNLVNCSKESSMTTIPNSHQ